MLVFLLSRYRRLGASSRLRFYQYCDYLAAEGISVIEAALFDDSYVEDLQKGHRSALKVMARYAKRIRELGRAGVADVIWLEKDALPWLPAWVELARLGTHVPLVLDYDDAVFHQYDEHRQPFLRRILGPKHPLLMQRATCVVAGNDYIANFARAAGARRVEVLPTVVDLERYAPRRIPAAAQMGPASVGWVGQRATAHFLQVLAPVFRTLEREGTARFTAIGIDATELGLPMHSVPWLEATEAEDIARLDVGIMPLVDAPYERGKCGYKLIQYMACGLPVVASPVGVNSQIVEHGVNGFLAETPDEWARALRLLCRDQSMRVRMGAAGRLKVEEQYCLKVTAPKLVQIMRDAANDG